MGWRDLFKRAPPAPPAPPQEDPRLGTLTWVAEHEGWCGVLKSLRFVLCHEKTSPPPEPLRAYAIEVLSDRARLQAMLDAAITDAPDYLEAFKDEMRELDFELLQFSVGPKGRDIFATLGPGRDYRSWRLEFEDLTCLGIGFDT